MLLDQAGLKAESRVIDVGSGASTLVDDLLERGLNSITMLDLSAASPDVAKKRLAERAERVQWMTGDITRIEFAPGACTH